MCINWTRSTASDVRFRFVCSLANASEVSSSSTRRTELPTSPKEPLRRRNLQFRSRLFAADGNALDVHLVPGKKQIPPSAIPRSRVCVVEVLFVRLYSCCELNRGRTFPASRSATIALLLHIANDTPLQVSDTVLLFRGQIGRVNTTTRVTKRGQRSQDGDRPAETKRRKEGGYKG